MKAVVIVARGLQARALACYGDPIAETPAVDALAAQGVVCDNHLADGADEASARCGWRSGRYGFPGNEGTGAVRGSVDLLECLRKAGIQTQLVVDGTRPVDDPFCEGWDDAEGVLPDEGETALEATVAVAEEAMEALADGDNWLLWVEIGTTLPPWDVPDEFQAPFFRTEPSNQEDEEDDKEEEEESDEDEEIEEEHDDEEIVTEPLTPLTEPLDGPIDPLDDLLYLRIHNSYAAAVSYLDAGIGKIWDAVVALELAEEVLFVVTADVGLSLGEHGIVGPGQAAVYEEIVHVPLIVRLPGGAHAGRRVTGLTQGVDLLPTLAALFGISLPLVHGHNLLPLLRGEMDQVRPYACSCRQVGTQLCWALRTLEWAYLHQTSPGTTDPAGTGQLFIKPDDGYEVSDVAGQYLELAEAMERTLRAFALATRVEGPLVLPPLEMKTDVATQGHEGI